MRREQAWDGVGSSSCVLSALSAQAVRSMLKVSKVKVPDALTVQSQHSKAVAKRMKKLTKGLRATASACHVLRQRVSNPADALKNGQNGEEVTSWPDVCVKFEKMKQKWASAEPVLRLVMGLPPTPTSANGVMSHRRSDHAPV
jgi:hypothetical protein